MSDTKLRQVAWMELFPWLALLRVFRLAIQARLLALATVGLLLTSGGWYLLGQLFGAELRDWTRQVEFLAGYPINPLVAVWLTLSGPFRELFAPALTVTRLAYLLLCALWADIVWSFFGAVITRLVALQVTRHERGSLRAAVRYVRGKWRAYFAAPLFPLLGVVLFVLPLALLGLLGQLGSPGLVVLSVLWPAFLVAALAITIFLVGLAFGWPLMWPTISAEGTDSFDALSRSYSYVYQRPLHYLWYAIVAGLLGTLGLIVVDGFAQAVEHLAAWGVSWGAGRIVLDDVALTEAAPTAARVLGFWSDAVHFVAASFAYTFFFSAATVIYFLLRQEVDGTETDEVFVDEQGDKFGLPPIAPDDAGVPVIAEGD